MLHSMSQLMPYHTHQFLIVHVTDELLPDNYPVLPAVESVSRPSKDEGLDSLLASHSGLRLNDEPSEPLPQPRVQGHLLNGQSSIYREEYSVTEEEIEQDLQNTCKGIRERRQQRRQFPEIPQESCKVDGPYRSH